MHLLFTGGQSEEEWRTVGARLRRERETADAAGSRQMWSVGDWLMAGEDRIFDRIKKRTIRRWAAEITGYSQHTLVMAVSVARKIDPSLRVDGLSWWHHLTVARLPQPEQSHWLSEAAERGWSVRELRAQLALHGHTSSRRRRPRGDQLIQQIVALNPDEVGDEVLWQLRDWLDKHSGERRVALAESGRVASG
jgi:hypothetical protein